MCLKTDTVNKKVKLETFKSGFCSYSAEETFRLAIIRYQNTDRYRQTIGGGYQYGSSLIYCS